ncbi:TIGR00296 family protein [Candidatus Micrarchaeota archaeon CG08_land_8_20_14_0_20_59_11]|nr:MAG: TIGR00296 family protein [Candidatus Micrarchaeota archaeon CG08_land_8_20_14_0_20_59_11]
MRAVLTKSGGRKLILLARQAISEYSASRKVMRSPDFPDKRGVFVTLHSFPSRELRGCIGFPYPSKPLGDAVCEAAVSAAFGDPRFPPVDAEEMKHVLVEVSVLTPPEELRGKREELPKKIKIGRDGLIIQMGPYSGLLLPQVPVEWKWDAKQFLEHLSGKAGLAPDYWKDARAKIYRFEAQVFSENNPPAD